MSSCSNCNNQLSCGCQRRTATNGTQVCSSCLAAYESKLQNQVEIQNEESVIDGVDSERYKNLHKFLKK
jgi:hypothetical protein